MKSKNKKIEIILQAGGRGSRLRHYTWNKPKCLVSYFGKPLIFYTFECFNNSNFHIIGDYQIDKLKKYFLISPPKVKYKIYKTNQEGTCAGISDVLKKINKKSQIIIIWADLIIKNFPIIKKSPTIFTTSSFTCRWSIKKNSLVEKTSSKRGIPGIFYFSNKKLLEKVPKYGEFVKWYSKNIKKFYSREIMNLKELGDFSSIEDSYNKIGYGRFFNEIKIKKNTIEKKAIDQNYSHLITREQNWYREVSNLNFRNIPKIISTNPYVMEKIKGNHVFDLKNLDKKKTYKIIENIITGLSKLHKTSKLLSDKKDLKEVYITKTLDRLNSVSKIIPNFKNAQSFTINGKKCKNYLNPNYKKNFKDIINILDVKYFSPIHGDPTFSNLLIKKNLAPVFIDPRGYFYKNNSIYGDVNYDFSKVYYSAIGNYDFFNRRKFKLYIDNFSVEILLDNILHYDVSDIFKNYSKENYNKIKILHGLIWLSLSGYVKDDIDSILGSFYNGLYWLNKALD